MSIIKPRGARQSGNNRTSLFQRNGPFGKGKRNGDKSELRKQALRFLIGGSTLTLAAAAGLEFAGLTDNFEFDNTIKTAFNSTYNPITSIDYSTPTFDYQLPSQEYRTF